MNDLSARLLSDALGSWAPDIRYFDEIDSTNREALEWAGEGAAEGCLVVADHQTAGRGRLDRSWFSVPGECLLFSVILRPRLAPASLGLVSIVGGASLAIGLGRLGFEAKVKWPNDVNLGGLKVAGMLAETKMGNGYAEAVVLGLGINVNLASEEMPVDLRSVATSLMIVRGERLDRLGVLVEFLNAFGFRYNGLDQARPRSVLEFYLPVCETLGKRVRIETATGVIEATATDIDSTGGLVLDSGQVVRAGDVVHVH